MKALETRYNGFRFRSRMEARWAIYFETCGLAYDYEPEGYDLSQVVCREVRGDPDCVCAALEALRGKDAWYLPDFFLSDLGFRDEPNPGLFFEVKGLTNDREEGRCLLLGALTQYPVIMATTAPFDMAAPQERLTQHWPGWDSYMCFLRCGKCGRIKITFAGGFQLGCQYCSQPMRDDDPLFRTALMRARAARF